MRGRLLPAVLILALVIGAAWEGRRWLYAPASSPGKPSVEPVEKPTVPNVPPVSEPVLALKQTPPAVPKKAVIPKKSSVPMQTHQAPVTPASTSPSYPTHPISPPIPTPPPPQEWKGNSGTSITHPGQIVVQNDTQWVRFWAEHHPEEVSPDVDFSRNMVVGIFLGERPADGFSVAITGSRIVSDAVVVDYVEHAPPPGTFQVSVEAYPYDIKVIPKSTLHVKFNQLTAQYLPDTSIIRSTGTKP